VLALIGALAVATPAQAPALTIQLPPAPLLSPAPPSEAPTQKPPPPQSRQQSAAAPSSQPAATPGPSPTITVAPGRPGGELLARNPARVSPPTAPAQPPTTPAQPKSTSGAPPSQPPAPPAYPVSASNPLWPPASAGRAAAADTASHTKLGVRPAPQVGHAYVSSNAGGAQAPASVPGGPRHGPPPAAGGQPPRSQPGFDLERARAPLVRHGLLPASPAPNPFAGLTIEPESGEAMRLVLISLAAMVLLGMLFNEELKPGLRARQLVERVSHRQR
jgi:hypothetical protein